MRNTSLPTPEGDDTVEPRERGTAPEHAAPNAGALPAPHTERFELLARTVGDALWDWDLRTGEVWRNGSLTTAFGYPADEVSATTDPWEAGIHPDDRDEVVGSLHAAIEGTDSDWHRTYRFLRHDGSVAYVSDRNHIVRDADGQAVRVVGGITDITHRARAEQELRASETRFRDLAEHSSEGIFLQVLSPEHRIEYINPAMEAMGGFTREQVYDNPALLRDAISPSDRQLMWEALEVAVGATEPVEIDFRRRDGDLLRVRIRGTPIRNGEGRVIRLQGAVTDITREHREQEALRAALDQQRELSELKTGFVQAVSHELRTPLTSILGFVELLLRRELPQDAQQDYLRRIAAGSERLHRLVNDILDLDRLAQPDTLIEPVEVDLARLAKHVVSEAEPASHPLHLDARPATTTGDEALLERVVDNLIRNACKHTPDGTPIWIQTHEPGTVVVEDAGPGIPVGLRESLFEPFQQGPGQRDHHSPGTGIGLALARRIVRLHDGAIHIGDRPGGGARFTVILPGRPATTTTSPAVLRSAGEGGHRGPVQEPT